MIEGLRRSFGSLLPLLVVAALVSGTLAVVLLHRSRSARGPATVSRSVLDVAILLSALAALYLTILVPIPLGDRPSRTLEWWPTESVALFSQPTLLGWSQALANIVLLAPLGALAPLRFERLRPFRRLATAALLTSLGIEVAQLVLPLGRVSSVDDLLMNTMGGMAGAIVTWWWWGRRKPSALDFGVRAAG